MVTEKKKRGGGGGKVKVISNSQCKLRPFLKKSLFPVHRVAIIVASREAAKSFFFKYIFSCCIETMWVMLRKKEKSRECEKIVPIRHL